MKFVFFGYDFMMPAVHRLLADGHELRGVFTFECDNIFNFNRELVALAKDLNIPFSLVPPQPAEIDGFIAQGCECFLSAGYLYKIPAIEEGRAYGINLHPSLLPKGRGLMPTPHIIIDHPDASGLTVHKLAQKIDAGDIIYQEALPVGPRETVETLSARIAMRAPNVLSRILGDLPQMWKNARVQNESEASTFKMPDEAMRTLDWEKGIDHVERTARAFGRYGSLAYFDNALWIVYSLDAWAEKHDHWPGDVVHAAAREIVIAVKGGFACLKEFQRAPAA
jgi:methionyl-tRNA formyltransferase